MRCHRESRLAGEGIPLNEVGTHPAIGQSPARGTGMYRIPSLRGLHDRGRLMSDGSISNIEELLNPQRTALGHPYGLTLDSQDRHSLIEFLENL